MRTNIWQKWILACCVVLLLWLFYKKCRDHAFQHEGFSQKEKFVLVKEKNVCDEFYGEIYDYLHLPSRRIPYELKVITENTQSSPETSAFLDVGSGTGGVLRELTKMGYRATGIDSSPAMTQCAKNVDRDANIVCEDVLNPMAFEKQQFTHILCLYYTLYHFSDKKQFFRNGYQWLKPGGFLVLHLVEKEKCDFRRPSGKWRIISSTSDSPQKRENTITFKDFRYKVTHTFDRQGGPETVVTETFTDHVTSHIRQNEMTWFMEDIPTILDIAKGCGFVPHGMMNMKKLGDEYQYLYFLERIL